MKKKFIILLFAILMATAGGAAALCACSDGDTATLGAPKNFMISDEFFILWDKVDGAERYVLEIDGVQYETEDNCFEMQEMIDNVHPVNVKVKAIAPSTKNNSDWVEYTYEQPTAALKYTLLDDGSGYAVKKANDSSYVRGLESRVIIPDYYNGLPVTQIAEEAFGEEQYEGFNPEYGINCNNKTTSVRMPHFLKHIGKDAFYACVALKDIDLPSNLSDVTIGMRAFEHCYALESIDLSYATELGSYAFYSCKSLKNIILPDDPPLIDIWVFHYTAWYNSQPQDQPLILNGDILYEYNGRPEDGIYQIPEGIKAISGGAFVVTKITKLIIPDGVTLLGTEMFYPSKIEEVVLPSDLKSIPDSTFRNCKELRQVCVYGEEQNAKDGYFILPDTLTSIGEWAFNGCSADTVVIPNKDITIKGRGLPYTLNKVIWCGQEIDGETFKDMFNIY